MTNLEIKPSNATQIVRLALYFAVFLFSCLFYTELFDEKMDALKLLMGKGIGVMMGIACIVELIKLRTIKRLSLTVNEQSISWGTTKSFHDINWETIKSVTIVGAAKAIVSYEFVLFSNKYNFGHPVLTSSHYDLEENDFLEQLKQQAQTHQFVITQV